MIKLICLIRAPSSYLILSSYLIIVILSYLLLLLIYHAPIEVPLWLNYSVELVLTKSHSLLWCAANSIVLVDVDLNYYFFFGIINRVIISNIF